MTVEQFVKYVTKNPEQKMPERIHKNRTKYKSAYVSLFVNEGVERPYAVFLLHKKADLHDGKSV